MYEIWLVLNIVYEIALGIWPVLLLALLSSAACQGRHEKVQRALPVVAEQRNCPPFPPCPPDLCGPVKRQSFLSPTP